MKNLLKILILTLLLINCKNNTSELDTRELNNFEITNEFKLEFLNAILADSSEFRLLNNKKELISNFPITTPPFLPIDPKNKKRSITHSQFISDTLKIKDIKFVTEQFQNNKGFSISEIKKYGYNIIDVKQYIENEIKWDSINKIAEKYYTENKLENYYSFLNITKPLFNKEQNLAYIRIRLGPKGMTRIYEKQNDLWNVKYEFGNWVE